MAVSISGDGAVTGVASINTDVSSTELGYLDGVTSAIQPQIAGAGGLVLVGQSSFTAASSVSLDGVFSADHDNYRVMVEVTSASANAELYWRLRASGTDLTTSTYYGSRIQSDFATNSVNGYSLNGTSLQLAYTVAGATSSIAVDIFAPYAARSTKISGHGLNASTNGNQRSVAGLVANTTQYDGMTIYPASGTITGTLRVYGYAQ